MLLAASVFSNPAFVGLVIALPSIILGYLGYRQSQKADAVAAQVDQAGIDSRTVEQIIEGQHKLNVALQADNTSLRELVGRLELKITRLEEKLDDLKTQLTGIDIRIP